MVYHGLMTNTPNPLTVEALRNARLVRDMKTPLYTSETPAPAPHVCMATLLVRTMAGTRTDRVPEDGVDQYLDTLSDRVTLLHMAPCDCGK